MGFLRANGSTIALKRNILEVVARAGAHSDPIYSATRLTESASSLDKFAGTTVFYSALQEKGNGV